MRWPTRGRTFGTAIATARATEPGSSPARLWRARRKGSISIVRTSTAEPSGSRECGPREGVNPEPDIAGGSRNIPNTGRPPGRPFPTQVLQRSNRATTPSRPQLSTVRCTEGPCTSWTAWRLPAAGHRGQRRRSVTDGSGTELTQIRAQGWSRGCLSRPQSFRAGSWS